MTRSNRNVPLSNEVPPRGKIYVDMRAWNPAKKRMEFIKNSSIILENFSPAEAKAVIGRALADHAAAYKQQQQEKPDGEKETGTA